ncbi:MAG: heptosyltransferase [Bacteroidetes bacterium]|nr:heptosyltransferase [Bacteroidota bacterium]
MSVKKEFNIISWGGLGDALLTTPVFRRLKEAYPACRINIFAVRKDHKKLFEGNPNIDTLTHSFFKRRKFYRDKTAVVPSYGHLLPGTFLKDHASSIIAEYFFNLQLNDLKPEIFLTGKEVRKAAAFLSEYKNPVIINPTSRSSANHEWDIRNWEKVVSQLPGFTFLQLGLKDEAYIKGAIDLRGKCSLRHSMALVKSAKAFVGVDSFLGHVAAATGTPAVVLFGDSTPLVWGHAANTNIYKALPCSPCVDILHGKKCFYGRPCMTGITVDEVIEAVQNHLTSHRDE